MYAILDRLGAERRTGVYFIDYYGHRRDYTFAEIADQSQRYASVLRTLGVEAGQTVALCNANTSKCLFLLTALDRIGAIPLLCGEDLSDEELLARIKAGSARIIITNRRRRRRVEWVQPFLPPDTKYVLVGEEHESWARMDTLAEDALPYAGGPHGPHPISKTVSTIARDVLQAQPDDRVWSTFPFGTDRWLAFVQAPLFAGAATIVHEAPFNARERTDLLHELEATILCQPAQEFEALLDAAEGTALRMQRLRRCVAVEASGELRERWQAATGKPLIPAHPPAAVVGTTPS